MGKLGFIGLGIMGRPMAENLLKGGQQVMVSDLNEAVVEELRKQGAESGSYTDLAKACDIIFTILPTGAIVQEVLFGENGRGLRAAARPGGVRHVQRHPRRVPDVLPPPQGDGRGLCGRPGLRR